MADFFDLEKLNATPTHYFVKLLQEKKMLWKYMTQNIDNLEQKAGLNMLNIVQAHGANRDAYCSNCSKKHDGEML